MSDINPEADNAEKIRAGLKAGEAEPDHVETGEPENDEIQEDNKPKVSDAEAKLMKDLMKHKAAAKAAAEQVKALEAKFGGIDIDQVKALLAAQAEEAANKEKAEEETLEKKGEYERLLNKQKEAAAAKVKEANERAKAAEDATAAMKRQIEDLTIGTAFSNSKFVQEKLTLTPNKTRQLYAGHFEFEDGKVVAYDKPKGSAERTKIVDDTGEAVDYETAIAAIINADPDKDYLLKAERKSGAGSKPSNTDAPKKGTEYVDTADKIANGLDAYLKAMNKK